MGPLKIYLHHYLNSRIDGESLLAWRSTCFIQMVSTPHFAIVGIKRQPQTHWIGLPRATTSPLLMSFNTPRIFTLND